MCLVLFFKSWKWSIANEYLSRESENLIRCAPKRDVVLTADGEGRVFSSLVDYQAVFVTLG